VTNTIIVTQGRNANAVCVYKQSKPMCTVRLLDNAAHDIQSAVDAAVAGATVLVTNGSITPAGGLLSARRPTVLPSPSDYLASVNGPTVTVIEGAGPAGDSAVREST